MYAEACKCDKEHNFLLLKITISSEFPLWTSVFCLLLGFGIAYLLYRKNNNKYEISESARYLLFFLRFAYISILAFLIISPFVLSLHPFYEKPIIIFAQDKSQSVKNLLDSTSFKTLIREEEEFIERCGDDFDINYINFGERIEVGNIGADFDHRTTNYSELFKEVSDRFENRNVAMMIVAGDGLFNRGENPVYSTSVMPFPVYSLAMGDTSLHKDAFIERIEHNNLSFLDNTFEIKVRAGVSLMKGSNAELNVKRDGKVYAHKKISINNDNYYDELEFTLKAEETGMLRYEVEIVCSEEEINYTNNNRAFYIEVLQGQQEVLILSSAPHPDVAALMSAINGSKQFNAKSILLKDFDGNLGKYNLLILNQLPIDRKEINTLNLKAMKIPVLFVTGRTSSIQKFNDLQSGLILERFRKQYNESSSTINKDFQFFSIDEKLINFIDEFPPLISPFADYKLPAKLNTLIYQKIGKVQTDLPQIAFLDDDDRKFGFIMGEGIWKWRLYDYKLNNSTEIFDNLIQSMIQFLGVREDKSRLRVDIESAYFENEDIAVNAEFYNKSYELVNDYNLEFLLKREDGKVFEFDFLKNNKSYRLNISGLEVGEYTWTTRLNDGFELFEKKGSFSIKALQLEYNVSRADYTFLFNLSDKMGGEVIFPGGLMTFANEIISDDSYKPLIHYNKSMKELISYKWLFFLLLFLFSLEWILRKYLGLV